MYVIKNIESFLEIKLEIQGCFRYPQELVTNSLHSLIQLSEIPVTHFWHSDNDAT